MAEITCTNCGKENVPDWDGEGHCISCARDLVTNLATLDELLNLAQAIMANLNEKPDKEPKGQHSTSDGTDPSARTLPVTIHTHQVCTPQERELLDSLKRVKELSVMLSTNEFMHVDFFLPTEFYDTWKTAFSIQESRNT